MKGVGKNRSIGSKRSVSSVANMNRMFMEATAFNGDISKWDVSNVADTNHMFVSAALFNGDISKRTRPKPDQNVSLIPKPDQIRLNTVTRKSGPL